MAVTAHFIGIIAINVDPSTASLNDILLCFFQLKEDHAGKKIAGAIHQCLQSLELPWEKVIHYLTLDLRFHI